MDISGEQLTKVLTTLNGKPIILNEAELTWGVALSHVISMDRTFDDPLAAMEIAHTLMHATEAEPAEGQEPEGVTLTAAQVKVAKSLTLAFDQFTNLIKAQILAPLEGK